MLCEMCGDESDSVIRVSVEGSILSVCPKCAKFGKPLATPATSSSGGGWSSSGGGPTSDVQDRVGSHQKRMAERDLYTELPDLELAPDWNQRIRIAREKMGLTQEQFGARINEKVSVVHKLESRAMVPPDALVRKLEKTLKVRLTEKPQAPTA